MFGYEERELLNGELFDRIFAPESLQAISQLNGDAGIYECIGKKKDGIEFPVEVNVRQIGYLSLQATVCTIRDITSRVKAEEEKLVLQSKLGKAQKLKALGLMAGSVAHDLNNILTGLVTYPDLLLYQMGESNKFYPSIKKIQESGKRASAVVNDLIMLARGRLPQAIVESINEIILKHLQSIEHTERQAVWTAPAPAPACHPGDVAPDHHPGRPSNRPVRLSGVHRAPGRHLRSLAVRVSRQSFESHPWAQGCHADASK